MLRRRRVAFALLLCLGLGACFEPPVLETLDLRFLRDGSFVVTSTVEITDNSENPLLGRRLIRLRQELEEGSDPWGRRFAALEPVAERFAWEKQLGEIHRGTRAALAGGPESLLGPTAPAPVWERSTTTSSPRRPERGSRRSPTRSGSGSIGSTRPCKR